MKAFTSGENSTRAQLDRNVPGIARSSAARPAPLTRASPLVGKLSPAKLSQVIAVIVLLTLLATPLALAQGGSVSIDQIDTSNYPDMAALVTALDANGVPVPNLAAGAFELVEDGRFSFPPSNVTTQVNPDAVVSIALVVDLSGSMRGTPLEEAQAASRNLLDALLEKDNDPDRVAFFGIKTEADPENLAINEDREVPFGNDKNRVLNVVNFLTIDAASPTPLYDALFRVVRITSEQGGRRAIIVISDGVDRVSQLEAEDPINEANRNNIPIFPISLSTNTVDEDYLQRLALRTGGIYRKAPQAEEFSDLFQQVLDQLKLQYRLEYQSQLPEDGNAHSLLVRVRSPRVESFDEIKFVLDKSPSAPTAADVASLETAVAETPEPAGAEAVAPATPAAADTEGAEEGEGGMAGLFDDITTFIQDNPLPAALIGLAVLLLLILLVLLVVWLRRRGQEATPAPSYDFDAGTGEDWQASPASDPYAAADYSGGTTGGVQPTVAETRSPTAASTEAATGPGYAPPAPVGPSGQPPAAPAGGTRILERAPKHVAMLIDRKDAAKRFDLLATTDIGRAQGSTITLSDATVSRQHARIRLEDDKFLLFDLGSANGTFVNDQQVEAPATLVDGDVVRFGEVEFTFKQLS